MKYHPARCLKTLLLLLIILTGGKVLAQQAGFNYTASPASLCAPVTFTLQNTTTGTPVMYTWDFGDGRSSHDANPSVTYTTGGQKTITLTAKYYNGESTYYRQITVGDIPAVDFNANITQSCKLYTATFTDVTPGAQYRTWDFGDGSAPVQSTTSTITHAYGKAGKFSVTLTVTNSTGCTQKLVKSEYINISIPDVAVTSPTGGCVPYTAAFSATATNPATDPVSGYTWNFGDGTIQAGNATINHTYAQTGTYDITVTMTTNSGCTVTKAFPKQIHTGNPPSGVSFTVSPTTACVGEPVRVLADAKYAGNYFWDFGDGSTLDTTAYDLKHNFLASGNLTIQLKAGSNGCYTSPVSMPVTITGPVSSFSASRSCTNRTAFTFTNTSTNTTATSTYEWDFGDNSPLETTQNTTHQYSVTGKYTVRLTVKDNNGACSHSSFQTVYYFLPDFTAGVSAICRGSKATYEVLNIPQELVASYTWQFGDGSSATTTQQSYEKTFPVSGNFDDKLIINYKDAMYCTDVVTKVGNIRILAPVADFAITGGACAGQPVNLKNTSATSPNTPLTNWRWDLGNGLASTAQTPPATNYSASGDYTVKLVITDARNCMDSITRSITINPSPFIKVSSTQAKICEGSGTTLNAITDGNVQWLVTDNLSCTYCTTPTASPVVNTRYKALATNAYGCTVYDSTDISVVPKVSLTVTPNMNVCYGSSAKLQATGATYYNWTPVDGLTNNKIADPVSTPVADITYQVTGTNDPMCPYSAPVSVKLSVKPVPSVEAGKDQEVPVGSVVRLIATGSIDVVKWQWSPTDYLDCTTCPAVSAAIRKPMTYSVTGTNAFGCSKSDIVSIDLVCKSDAIFIPNTFSPNGDGVNDIFYPRGKGISFVKSFRIFNRWGQEVYHREQFNTDDISKGWDGMFKGKPQSADVYIYFIEAYCDTNEFMQLKGNVTLVR
ncbi:PKD domain-containing protein [Chitinophaga sp. Cy-1792]|uniref:PKD domain-containing protein n=1 Tax=Chitinophaga sp. Cy-1792 TaxID=2608339 RepID=UPI00141FD9B6|nr:PKD domain-containing protein [Chitinophaga sp. Cy-1792]NIG53287.1 PKD domain-containing protein [Chitinophaga sp. Cy-1792]